MGRSGKVISAVILWAALWSGSGQAQSSVQPCGKDFRQTATGEQVLVAIAAEGAREDAV